MELNDKNKPKIYGKAKQNNENNSIMFKSSLRA